MRAEPVSILNYLRQTSLSRFGVILESIRKSPHHLRGDAVGCAVSLREVSTLLEDLPNQVFPPSIRSAPVKRRVSFAAGRLCAEHLMGQFGVTSPILMEDSGAPVWPESFQGSITHNEEVACAVVGKGFSGIGIDSEKIVDQMAHKMIEESCYTPSERVKWKLQNAEGALSATVLFSAKEAFFKASYPRVRRHIDFVEVEVTQWSWSDAILTIRFHNWLEGICHFKIADGTIHTSVQLD